MSRTHSNLTHYAAPRRALAMVAALGLLLAPVAEAARTKLKPGINRFSTKDDVEIGRKVSADAERQLPMLNDAKVDRYVDRLGKKLAAVAQGEKFPYQFKVVNDKAINAFALPGGFIYVNRGIIEAAENEGQLAGVMGHEIGHVALRHGTNQATKASLIGGIAGAVGIFTGADSVGAMVAQLGASFGANSILLKYSRDAERQADLLGTHVLYDTGFDPRAIAQFFEKLQAEEKGGRMPQFFSSHPNPENRVAGAMKEVDKMGGAPRGYHTDSAEFREIKRYVASLPPPPKKGASPASQPATPPAPSRTLKTFQNQQIALRYPDNWKVQSQGNAALFHPEGGVVRDSAGNAGIAYGVMVDVFEPKADRSGQITLEDATNQLLEQLRHANPEMRARGNAQRVRLDGQRGLSTLLTNPSPIGGTEYNWVISVLRPAGLVYVVFTVPEAAEQEYNAAFQAVADSIRFPRQ